MKTMKLIPLFLLMLLTIACGENRGQEAHRESDQMAIAGEERGEVDQVMDRWKQAWNNNDSESLEKMAADDAVLLFFGEAKTNGDLKKWISETSAWMKDLNSTPLVKNVGENMAYEAGTFTHRSKANDTMQYEGAYVVVWERPGKEGEWKIKLMDVSPRVDMDTLAGPPPAGE